MGNSILIISLAMVTFGLVIVWAWGSKQRALKSLDHGDRSHATDNVNGGNADAGKVDGDKLS